MGWEDERKRQIIRVLGNWRREPRWIMGELGVGWSLEGGVFRKRDKGEGGDGFRWFLREESENLSIGAEIGEKISG